LAGALSETYSVGYRRVANPPADGLGTQAPKPPPCARRKPMSDNAACNNKPEITSKFVRQIPGKRADRRL